MILLDEVDYSYVGKLPVRFLNSIRDCALGLGLVLEHVHAGDPIDLSWVIALVGEQIQDLAGELESLLQFDGVPLGGRLSVVHEEVDFVLFH